MIDRQFLENMAALEAGIVIMDCNIAEQLAKMSPSDARAAKRKWRKLTRKQKKKTRAIIDQTYAKSFAKYMIRRDLSNKMQTKFTNSSAGDKE